MSEATAQEKYHHFIQCRCFFLLGPNLFGGCCFSIFLGCFCFPCSRFPLCFPEVIGILVHLWKMFAEVQEKSEAMLKSWCSHKRIPSWLPNYHITPINWVQRIQQNSWKKKPSNLLSKFLFLQLPPKKWIILTLQALVPNQIFQRKFLKTWEFPSHFVSPPQEKNSWRLPNHPSQFSTQPKAL